MGLGSAGLDNPVHLWWGQCLQPQTLSSPLLQQQSFLRHPEFKGTPFNQPKLTTPALPASGCTQLLGDNRLKIRRLCQFSCALSSVIKTPVLFSCAHCLGLSALELPAWQRCLGQDPRRARGVCVCVHRSSVHKKSQTSGRRPELGLGGKWTVMVFHFLMRPKCLLFSPLKCISKMLAETIASF